MLIPGNYFIHNTDKTENFQVPDIFVWKKYIELTNRKHCLKIPPLDIFFSASSSPKFNELANISTSAMLTSL